MHVTVATFSLLSLTFTKMRSTLTQEKAPREEQVVCHSGPTDAECDSLSLISQRADDVKLRLNSGSFVSHDVCFIRSVLLFSIFSAGHIKDFCGKWTVKLAPDWLPRFKVNLSPYAQSF